MPESLTLRANAEAAAERLRVLAHPTRLMILAFLRRGEQSVSQIEQGLGLKQPGLSQQLGELRQAELVGTRREAKSVFYRLADDKVGVLLNLLETAARPLDAATPAPQAADLKPPRRTQSGAAMFAKVSPAQVSRG